MNSASLQLTRRVTSLEERLLRVERELGLRATPETRAIADVAEHPEWQFPSEVAAPPASRKSQPRAVDFEPAGATIEAAQLDVEQLDVNPVQVVAEVVTPAEAVSESASAQPAQSKVEADTGGTSVTAEWSAWLASVERVVGGRWYAVLGAVIVMIGIALFFKLAVQQGWIAFNAAARCFSAAAFGCVLIGVGEYVRRRSVGLGAAALMATGLGTLYATAYAAYGYYGLVSAGAAFAMMAAVALIGIGVASFANFASIAVLSLVGGYATPFILWGFREPPAALPVYLIALLTIGLVLSAWRGGKFVGARMVVWWGTMVLGGLWVVFGADGRTIGGLAFLGITWAAIQIELVVSARRFGAKLESEYAEGWSARAQAETRKAELSRWRVLASSFSTTAWAATLGVFLANATGLVPKWFMPAGLFVACSGLAMVIGSHLRMLRDVPRTDEEQLGACLAVQSAALLIATVAFAIGGAPQVIAWTAMALAAGVCGWWIRSRALGVYGVVLLVIATLRMLTIERFSGTLPGASVALSGVTVSAWSAMMLVVGSAWVTLGLLSRRVSALFATRPVIGHCAIAVGLTALFGSIVPATSVYVLATLPFLLGVAAMAAGKRLDSAGIRWYGLGVMVLGSIALMTTAWWEPPASSPAVVVMGLHLTWWTVVLSIAALAWMSAGALVPNARTSSLGEAPTVIGVLIALGSVMSTEGAATSLVIIAGLAGVTMARIGLRDSRQLMRWIGLGVLAVVTAAAVGWRIARADESVGMVGVALTEWTCIIAGLAGVWMCIGRRESERLIGELEPGVVRSILGMGLLMLAVWSRGAEAGALAVTWSLIALGVGFARYAVTRLRLDAISAAGMAAAVCAWLLAHPPFAAAADTRAGVMMSGGFLIGMGLTCAMALMAWLVVDPKRAHAARLRGAVIAGAIGVFAVASSVEVSRSAMILASDPTVRRAAISVWWTVLAFGAITAGFVFSARGFSMLRPVGLGLLGIAAAKALTLDLAEVDPLARVVSFVVIGLTMLAVAVTYARVSGRLIGVTRAGK